MFILIAIAAALALLYFWLLGHWFARVLVFVPLTVLGFLGGFALVNVGIYDKHAPSTAPAFIVGISLAAMAWPLSSLPIYVRRRRVTAAVRA